MNTTRLFRWLLAALGILCFAPALHAQFDAEQTVVNFGIKQVGTTWYDTLSVTSYWNTPLVVELEMRQQEDVFALVNTPKVITLHPGMTEHVVVSFTPSRAGFFESVLSIHNSDFPSINVLFIGTGNAEQLQLEYPAMISLDAMVNAKNDTVFAIRNMTGRPASVDLAIENTQFALLPGFSADVSRIQMNPYGVAHISVSFLPRGFGLHQARLWLISSSPGTYGDTLGSIELNGNGFADSVPFELNIRSVETEVGDTAALHLSLAQTGTYYPAMMPAESALLHLTLRWNSSVFLPLPLDTGYARMSQRQIAPDSIEYDVYLPLSASALSTWTSSVPIIGLLGNAVQTHVFVDRAELFFPLQNVLLPVAVQGNTTVRISDIWYYGSTPRLVNVRKGALALSAFPNPVTGPVSVKAQFSGTKSLTLWDPSGRLVADLSDRLGESLSTFHIDMSTFTTSGVYVLRLANEDTVVVQLLVVP